MKRYALFLILSSIFSLEFISCKKCCYDKTNPECENYDPCFGKSETNANFQQLIQFGDKYIDIDSFAIPEIWDLQSGVTFKAIQSFDSSWWEHGSEIIRNQSQFNRLNYPNGKISTKLILFRKPNKNCFPFDNGIDTVEKYFNIVPVNKGLSVTDQSLLKDTIDWPIIFGTYEGYVESNPSVKRIVKIGVKYYCIQCASIEQFYWLSGIPYQNSRPTKKRDQLLFEPPYNYYDLTPSAMFFKYGHQVENVNFLYELNGTALLQKDNLKRLVFDFSYIDSTGYTKNEPQHSKLKRIHDRFIGIKIDNRFLEESTTF
jgi:hypothetical protein